MSDLKNKTVIITGASSGIGKSAAVSFAKRGAGIVLAARREAKLQDLKKVLEDQFNSKVLTVKADVTIIEDCRNLINKAAEEFGGIDILINNAGISMRALFEDAEIDTLKKLMDVNFWGAVYCTKFALPYIQRSKGSIVAVSSIAGYRGLPARSGYSASKFAMQGFFESLRTENLKKNIHVMVICPGFTESNIRKTALDSSGNAYGESPLNETKIMTAEEVAEYMVKGILKRKRDIILTRQGKLTVFMNKWLPSFMDKMVYKHFAKEKDSPVGK